MRSINSPGVQIKETDLSLTQQFGGATNVFVAGFADQGPIDEVLLVSTVSEFEQIYGIPQTPAERYFYYSCKEVLNSPATLLTTRLPYGSGSGSGFDTTQYNALFYPVVETNGSFKIGAPTIIALNEQEYETFSQNNITWSLSGGNLTQTLSTSFVTEPSSWLTVDESVSAVIEQTILNDPGYVAGSLVINFDITTVDFSFDYNVVTGTVVVSEEYTSGFSTTNAPITAGIILLNSSQTTVNQNFEGYYITLTDNTEFGPATDFTAVNALKGYSDSNTLFNVPNELLGFALSGTLDSVGQNSISENIERIPTFNFGSDFYRDSLIFNVFKIRRSIYEPQILSYTLAESHIGSLDANKKTAANVGGIKKSFYLEDVINENSSNVKVLINPNISKKVNWTSLVDGNPAIAVETTDDNKSMFPLGVYSPTFKSDEDKKIGSVSQKLTRALTHIETSETVLVDVLPDAGLSTIAACTNTTDKEAFNDAMFIDSAEFSNPNSDIVARWRDTFNVFNTFVSETRKDCVYISDPIRQIFVNGENTKTMSVRSNTFSTNIYTPLNSLYSSINTNYSAAYANWVKQYDPYADKQVWLPASGYVAAVYARTDTNTQPWIAPAGFSRGTINSIVDLAFNPNQKQRDFLYTISLNPIVSFSGDGFVVFGQKTLQTKPSAFDRVNVRRLFLTLERAVGRTIKYFVFEPNTEITRTQVRSTIAPIFELAKNTEGLYDYLIVCDERNNTPDTIDRNELLVDIYIKPVRAAEFILVNFIATRTGQDFAEII